MTKDMLTTCEGWTPIIDILASELGLMTAACYGIVWRYCQMKTGVCYASISTLAKHLGVSEKSVRRHLAKLCSAGYLQDTTPGRRNKPHIYRDTAKVELRGSITVVVGQADQAKQGGRSESPTGLDTETNEDTKETIVSSEREKSIWTSILSEVKLQIRNPETLERLAALRFVSHDDGVIVLAAPNEYTRQWIENRLLSQIERAAAGVEAKSIEVIMAL